jgi:hypothetical protein
MSVWNDWGRAMRGFHNSSFDPPTLMLLETAFDEAWLTLKSIGNTTVKPDELARGVLRLAMEGERDPVRLHDGALEGLLPAATWREASWSAALAARHDPEQQNKRPVLQRTTAAGAASGHKLPKKKSSANAHAELLSCGWERPVTSRVSTTRCVWFRSVTVAGTAPAQAWDQWESKMKLIILFVVVVGAILIWWLRSVKFKRRI